MGNLNNPGCVEFGKGNTGVPGCDLKPDKIIGAILVDPSFVLETKDFDTFITVFQAATLATGKNRIYPVFRFEEVADNSEDETINTLGYGTKEVVKDGNYDWTFRMTKTGLCLHNRLRTFNKHKMKALFIDSDNVLFGTQVQGGIGGFTLDFTYAKPFKVADGSNPALFNLRFSLTDPAEFNEKVAYLKQGTSIEASVKGLIDVELVELAKTTNKATIGVKTVCDHVDLYDTYADELADPTNWVASKAGTPAAIATAVKNTTLKGWDLTITGGTGNHDFELADPAILAGNDFGGAPENGYEGVNSLTIDIT